MSDRNNLAALATGPTRRQLIAGVAISSVDWPLGATEAGREPRMGFHVRRNPFQPRGLFFKGEPEARSNESTHRHHKTVRTRSYNSSGGQ